MESRWDDSPIPEQDAPSRKAAKSCEPAATAREATITGAPFKDTPAKEASIKDTSTKEASVKGNLIKDTPIKENLTKEAKSISHSKSKDTLHKSQSKAALVFAVSTDPFDRGCPKRPWRNYSYRIDLAAPARAAEGSFFDHLDGQA